jgi:hypothetical protein
VLSLVWRKDAPNPLVETIVAIAESLADVDGRPTFA